MNNSTKWYANPGCLSTLTVLSTLLFLTEWIVYNTVRFWTFDEVMITLQSPTGAWQAQLYWHLDVGPIAGLVVAQDRVELLSLAHSQNTVELFWVDTTGNDEQHPRIAWMAPNVLRITAKNLSDNKLLVTHVDGVDVELRYDPDDPAARAAWLKKTGRTEN